MKEATGELNMTVIAVVAIAAVGAFFYAFIWPRISSSINNSTRCADAICSDCEPVGQNSRCTHCVDSNGEDIQGSCTFKGTNVNNNNNNNN